MIMVWSNRDDHDVAEKKPGSQDRIAEENNRHACIRQMGKN
jgi:hypothetical protein